MKRFIFSNPRNRGMGASTNTGSKWAKGKFSAQGRRGLKNRKRKKSYALGGKFGAARNHLTKNSLTNSRSGRIGR
tara:strand:- start:779 stop:1003 length:225 start_codon:yes stop_codon:yes gene_type:complete